jgi:hypothetical protein
MKTSHHRRRYFSLPQKPKSKYGATRVTYDGINFDSKAECEMYKILKADSQTLHVDVHVFVTLPGGLRLNVDFIVYKKCEVEEKGIIEAIEVKGKPDGGFHRMRQLFDETHPLAPMKVFRKTREGEWESL